MVMYCEIVEVEPGHKHVVFQLEFCRDQVNQQANLTELDRKLIDAAGEPTAPISEQLRALAMIAQRLEEAHA